MPHARTRFVFVCLIALLTACSPVQNAAPAPVNPSTATDASPSVPPEANPGTHVTLRVAAGRPPGSQDPAQVSLSDTVGRDLVESLYVGLTRLDADTNHVQPALAASWTTSPDGLRWTFQLREDVPWVAYDPQAGALTVLRAVSADDVVYAIWRACHPATGAPDVAALFVIHGCREINNTDPALITEELLATTIRAVAVSPSQVNIELETEAAYFLSLTALPILRPAAREAFAETDAAWRDAGLLATSGPFAVRSLAPGEQVTLVANPDWPLGRDGNVTDVEVRFTQDEAQADVTLLPGPPSGQPATLVRVEPRVAFIAFAADQFPTNDAHVRRALSAAIDRQRIVDTLLGGDGLAMAGFVPPGSADAPPASAVSAVGFDADYAREQMTLAGYPRCQVFPRLTVMTDRSAASLALAQAYVRMWEDTLGCNDTRFDLQQADMRLLLQYANTPLAAEWQTRPEIMMVSWQADYLDAHNWLGDVLHCERGYLQLGRPCEAVDDLIERALGEPNPDARVVLHAQIEGLFFGEDGLQPVAPIYADVSAVAARPGVTLAGDLGAVTAGPIAFDRWLVAGTP